MIFFFALHPILSSYFDVVDTRIRTRPSNVVNTRYSASPSNFPRGASLVGILSHLGFESLREFVAHKIKMMTSDCAQAFFGCDDKHGQTASRSKNYRVCQVTMDSDS